MTVGCRDCDPQTSTTTAGPSYLEPHSPQTASTHQENARGGGPDEWIPEASRNGDVALVFELPGLPTGELPGGRFEAELGRVLSRMPGEPAHRRVRLVTLRRKGEQADYLRRSETRRSEAMRLANNARVVRRSASNVVHFLGSPNEASGGGSRPRPPRPVQPRGRSTTS